MEKRGGVTRQDDKQRTNEQGKIGLLSLWAVGRLSFAIQTSPQNPPKATSGTKNGHRKVIFAMIYFVDIFHHFPISMDLFFQMPIWNGDGLKQKKSKENKPALKLNFT